MLRGSVRVIVTAAAGAAALALSVAAASASCGSCACGYYYAPPPVVYAPQPSCGFFYPARPAYRVVQGPIYAPPVETAEEPVPEYGDPYTYPYVGHQYRYRAAPRYTWLPREAYRDDRIRRPDWVPSRAAYGPRFRFGPRFYRNIRVDIDRRPHMHRGPDRPPVHMMPPRSRDPRKS